jgi:hypothetical protein
MARHFALKDTAYRVKVTHTRSDFEDLVSYYGPYSSKSLAKREHDKYKQTSWQHATIESAPVGEWTEEDPELRS